MQVWVPTAVSFLSAWFGLYVGYRWWIKVSIGAGFGLGRGLPDRRDLITQSFFFCSTMLSLRVRSQTSNRCHISLLTCESQQTVSNTNRLCKTYSRPIICDSHFSRRHWRYKKKKPIFLYSASKISSFFFFQLHSTTTGMLLLIRRLRRVNGWVDHRHLHTTRTHWVVRDVTTLCQWSNLPNLDRDRC